MTIGLSFNRAIEDFEKIWEQNIVLTTVFRLENPETGNYGEDDETSTATTSEVFMNIQGVTSGSYDRNISGIITPGSVFHAFAKYTANLQNDDRVHWNGIIFKVQNWNKSYTQGSIVWNEFDLVVVGYE